MYKSLKDALRVIDKNKPDAVIDHFVGSYLQGQEYEAWIDTQKADHAALYPKQIPNPDYVAPLDQRIVNPDYVVDGEAPYWIPNPDYVDPVAEFLPNPDYIEFDTWLVETQPVQVGTRDILGEDGFTVTGTEPIMEDQLIRSYTEQPVDIEQFKIDHYDRLRKAAYPPIEDWMDAWVKDDTAAMDAYKQACLNIKTKYKKVK